METIKAISKRKSVRAYKSEQISMEVLDNILAAGCAAPVGMSRYDTLHLTVMRDKAILSQLTGILRQMLPDTAKQMMKDADPLYGAPTVVLISSMEPLAPGADYANAGCIAENMMLAAADAGVGSVVLFGVGNAVEADTELKKTLKIPNGFTSLFGIAFGYAAKDDQTYKDLKITISMNCI